MFSLQCLVWVSVLFISFKKEHACLYAVFAVYCFQPSLNSGNLLVCYSLATPASHQYILIPGLLFCFAPSIRFPLYFVVPSWFHCLFSKAVQLTQCRFWSHKCQSLRFILLLYRVCFSFNFLLLSHKLTFNDAH